MTYHIAKPYRPGWAIPQYIKDEGLKRHAFTTMPSPQGTYDNPELENAAYRSGYVIPGYILKDGYGGGASVTKWSKRGSYFGPKIPNFLDKPANQIVAVQPSPNGGTAITVAALSGLGDDSAPLPDDFHAYGQQAATLILKGVRTQAPKNRKAMLKTVLDRVDPTLYNRTSKISNGLVKRGVAPAAALHAGLAQAMGTGMYKEVIKTGQSGKVPPARGQLGLGCYGICGSGSALGGSVDLRAGKRTRSTGLRGLLGLGVVTAATGQEISLTPTATQNTGVQAVVQPGDPGQPYLMNIGPTNPDGSAAGPIWIIPASFMNRGAAGKWIQNADGSQWSGENPDGSLVGGAVTYDAGNYLKDASGNVIGTQTVPPGTRIANSTGTLRAPYYSQRLVGPNYTPSAFETMVQATNGTGANVVLDPNNWIVTTYIPNAHQAQVDDIVISMQSPFLDGAFADFQWQTFPPNGQTIDNLRASNDSANVTYTTPASISPNMATLILSAITGVSGTAGYGNYWNYPLTPPGAAPSASPPAPTAGLVLSSTVTNSGVSAAPAMPATWAPGQLAQYQSWLSTIGITADQNYYLPMLDGLAGYRQRPIAKFTHPLCVAMMTEQNAEPGQTIADPATTCAGWGVYLFLEMSNPTQPWSTTNPYVLRMYVATEPQSAWDFVWNGIKTLAAAIVQDAETVLSDLGQAACSLVSNANTTKLSTTAAVGVNVAKIACGTTAPPPVQTGMDTATLLLIAGGAIAVFLTISAAKKHNRKAAT